MSFVDKVTDAWARAWGDGDTNAFVELTTDGYRRISKTGEEDIQHVVKQITESHTAFSDFGMDVLQVVEGDGIVAIHWRSGGKHTGEFMGVPATFRDVTVHGASFISHSDGKITEENVIWDPREMLSALGIFHLGEARRKKKPATQ